MFDLFNLGHCFLPLIRYVLSPGTLQQHAGKPHPLEAVRHLTWALLQAQP